MGWVVDWGPGSFCLLLPSQVTSKQVPQIILNESPGSSSDQLKLQRRNSLTLRRPLTAVEEVFYDFRDYRPPLKTKSQPNLHELSDLHVGGVGSLAPQQVAIGHLLEHEKQSRKHYPVPLVGCVPPSALDLPEDLPVSSWSPASLQQLLINYQTNEDCLVEDGGETCLAATCTVLCTAYTCISVQLI